MPVHLFNRYLLSDYYVSNTGMGIEDMAVDQLKSLS